MKRGLRLIVMMATFTCAGQSATWKPLPPLLGTGGVDGTIAVTEKSWVWLKLRWGNNCNAPRHLIVSAMRGGTELSKEGEASEILPVGERWFPLPFGVSTVKVRMVAGAACDIPTRVEVSYSRESKPESQATATAGKKTKPPKLLVPPSQPDIHVECGGGQVGWVDIQKIYSHKLSLFSGIGAAEPGLEAVGHTSCAAAISVFITVAYFDSGGLQFGSGIEQITIAPFATFPFYHFARLYGMDRARLKLAKVISVQAYPL